MVDHFLNGVLPIFSIGLLGFFFGKRKIFNFDAAMVLNKFVMLVGVPSLIFLLLSKAPMSEFNFKMLSGYFFVEAIIYLTGFLVAKLIFFRDTKESVLIGLCIALTNHVLFALPNRVSAIGKANKMWLVRAMHKPIRTDSLVSLKNINFATRNPVK